MERRRGRPPHPDILTPREWEVLELLRQSVTNEEIAQRLGITVPGAKYHVSQILSKLSVSSREQAAAWQPEDVQRRRAWLSLPIAVKTAGVVVVVAAIIGIATLAYGVTRTREDDDSSDVVTQLNLDDLVLGDDPARDRALLDSSVPGDIARVEIRPSNGGALQEEFDLLPASPLDDVNGWLVRVTTRSETYPGFLSGPIGRPDPPGGCYISTTWRQDSQTPQPDNVPVTAQTAELVDDSECDVESIDRDTAIVIAGGYVPRGPRGETSPPLVASTTLGAAVDSLLAEGFDAKADAASADSDVWLVLYTGPAVDPLVPSPEPISGQPTPAPFCSRVATIVDAANGDVLLSETLPAGAC